MLTVLWWNGFVLHNLPPSSHIWSQIEAIVYLARISKSLENDDHSIEIESYVCHRLWHLFPHCTIKAGRSMSISKWDILSDLLMPPMPPMTHFAQVHLHTSKMLSVWHQLFLINSGQTHKHVQTNIPDKNIITSLSQMIVRGIHFEYDKLISYFMSKYDSH